MKEEAGGSKKRELIGKANSRMLIYIGIAGAVFGFSLVVSINLIKQMNYKGRVISARSTANKQLEANIKSVDKLIQSYESFNSASESVLGTADENAKVVLDALPSRYDFPALALSLERVMTLSGLKDINIGGSDAEATAEQSSASPSVVEIPVTLTGTGNYQNIQQLLTNLDKSIRPIKISNITLSGSDNDVTVTITGVTYYQPKKTLEIQKEEVK